MRKRAKQLRKLRQKSKERKRQTSPGVLRRANIEDIQRLPWDKKELLMKKTYTALEAERVTLMDEFNACDPYARRGTETAKKAEQLARRITKIKQNQRLLEATYIVETSFGEKIVAVILKQFGTKWREELK